MPATLLKLPEDQKLPHAIGIITQSRIVPSLLQISPDAWNACFPGELEDYHYLLAVEASGIEGFTRSYAIVEEGTRLLAAMPAFISDYQLDTTLDDGIVRRAIRRIRNHWPRFLTMRLACLGSPETEAAHIGFHPSVKTGEKAALASDLLAAFEYHARLNRCPLLGMKDIPEHHIALWREAAPRYTALPGMPGAQLDITFPTIEAYLQRLSKKSRKDMRRKRETQDTIHIERHTDITPLLPQITALYQGTKNRSEFQFGELTGNYFQNIMTLKNRASCTLYYHGTQLLAFNLMLENTHTLLDKFFCMDATEGRKHNLYFLSWFHNIQYCLDHGITRYQSGQAGYENKIRLKSRLTPNWMLFRHTNPVLGLLLKAAAPWLAMEDKAL